MHTRLMVTSIGLLALLAGCNSQVSKSIASYHQLAPKIRLGQSKSQVLAILNPTQENLPLSERRAPEQYKQGDIHVEIYFFRSSAFYDGLLTDDELTPYVFHNGILHAVGWTALGGPKTQGQLRPEQNITILR